MPGYIWDLHRLPRIPNIFGVMTVAISARRQCLRALQNYLISGRSGANSGRVRFQAIRSDAFRVVFGQVDLCGQAISRALRCSWLVLSPRKSLARSGPGCADPQS